MNSIMPSGERRVPRPTELSVYFDGGCPLCRREIAFYKRRTGADRIDWIDVATCPETALPNDVSREALLKRFHIRLASGELVSGAVAFREIWARLPVFKPLAWLANIPGIDSVLEFSYRRFLQIRPRIQKWVTT